MTTLWLAASNPWALIWWHYIPVAHFFWLSCSFVHDICKNHRKWEDVYILSSAESHLFTAAHLHHCATALPKMWLPASPQPGETNGRAKIFTSQISGLASVSPPAQFTWQTGCCWFTQALFKWGCFYLSAVKPYKTALSQIIHSFTPVKTTFSTCRVAMCFVFCLLWFWIELVS